MPVSPEDLVIYLSLISEEKNLQVMVPQNIKGGIITGTSATVGGFCGGPVGLLIGGAFGGTVAAVSCKDRCTEVKDILVTLNYSKRTQLFEAFQDLLANELNARNFSEFSSRVEKNIDLKHEILRKFKEYIIQVWKLTIFDPRIIKHPGGS